MTNQIPAENTLTIDDIKTWLGGLLLENYLLEKKIATLRKELEQQKVGLSSDSPTKKGN